MTPKNLRDTADVIDRMMAVADPRREPIVAAIRQAADLSEKIAAMIEAERAKLAEANTRPAGEVSDNLKILHAARLSALQDLME